MSANPGGNKQKLAEAKVGMPLRDYFKIAVNREMTQTEMALELGVSRATVSYWIRFCGYKAKLIYEEAAASGQI